jgi:hypothetical protein
MCGAARVALVLLAAASAAPGTACSSAAAAKQDAVLEAALAYEITQFLGQEALAVCVQTSDGRQTHDPSPALLERLSRQASVHGASACRVDGSGVTVKASLQPAILLSAGPIDWVAENEAQVQGRYFRNGLSLAHPTYRVVREGRRWACLGPVMRGLLG